MAEDEFFKRLAEVDDGSAAVMVERPPGTAEVRLARGRGRIESREGDEAPDLDGGEVVRGLPAKNRLSTGDASSSDRLRSWQWVRPALIAGVLVACIGIGALGAAVLEPGSQVRELSLVPIEAEGTLRPLPALGDSGAVGGEKRPLKRERRGHGGAARAPGRGRQAGAQFAPVADPVAAAAPAPPPSGGTRERFGFEDQAP